MASRSLRSRAAAIDRDSAPLLVGQVGQAVANPADQRGHVDRFGRQHAAALARQLQDRVDQPVHLRGRGADEADRLGQVLARRDLGFVA